MRGASQNAKLLLTSANSGILDNFTTQLHNYTATALHGITLSESVEAPSCPIDGRRAVQDAYRLIVLESLLPKMLSEKGRVTFMRRWLGVPDGLGEADASRMIAERLASSEDHVAEVMSWGDGVEKVGSSLTLPAPPPPSGRWQGEVQWVRGASQALSTSVSPRLRRVGTQHRKVILQAIASFADRGTGCGVTASNRTLGLKAAELCRRHLERGEGWAGRRTDELSDRTLQDHVGCVVAALIDAGWMRERARGRKLTAFERVEAWARFRIFQTQAASVRDLVVPEESRVDVPRVLAPRWQSPTNPFVVKKVLSGLVGCVGEMIKHPVLRTYPSFARLGSYLQVLYGYLTRKNASAEEQVTSRRRRTNHERPSLPAQRLVAQLLDVMPWLRRSRTVGRPTHTWTLARVVDRVGLAGLDADAVVEHIDRTLRERYWELHPELIADPVGWFTTAMQRMAGPRE